MREPVDCTNEAQRRFPIKALEVFPLRGVISLSEPEYIDVSRFGVKYDRELALVPVHWETDPLGKTSLRYWG